jgi:invasion protein IalB
MVSRCCWRTAFGIFVWASLSLAAKLEARGDDAAAIKPAAKSPEALIEGRGERQLPELIVSGWRKLCFRLSGTGSVCRTTISGASEAGQEMLRVDLIEGSAVEGGRLQIFVPPMLFLEAGVRVSIDQGAAVTFPFAWCLSNTCVAAHAVDADFVRRMKSGKKMTLKVVDARVSSVMTSLPLDRFAVVNQGPPSLVFGESLEGAPPKM